MLLLLCWTLSSQATIPSVCFGLRTDTAISGPAFFISLRDLRYPVRTISEHASFIRTRQKSYDVVLL